MPVNQQLCARPTPEPAPAFALAPEKKPTPDLGLELKSGREALGLACFSSAPEPFNYAGVFVRFCLKKPAKIQMKVFHEGGALLRTLDGGDFRPGDSQIFFNALDDQGNPLPAGGYIYQLFATDGSYTAMRQGSFTRGPDKRR